MQISNIPKEKRFYKYLLELTKLTGKVIRDYKDYEKHWNPNEIKEIEGCYVEDDLDDEDVFGKLKVHNLAANLYTITLPIIPLILF